MQAPKIYRISISDMETAFGLNVTPIKGDDLLLFHHPQLPNSTDKKVAIKFEDKNGVGYDVYEYKEKVDYITIPPQYYDQIGLASIQNKDAIIEKLQPFVKFSTLFHKLTDKKNEQPMK